ncbi:YybH family protein [Mycobacterium conspicuum]|nr:nuclear transport factor 2 family protein [Mycobacterium conspicuum]
MSSFAELPAADQEAIGKTLLTLLKAFDDRDADALLTVYSDDADWVNAFGTVKRGRRDIVEYLRGLFVDDNFNRGELAGPPETSFKVLTPGSRPGVGAPAGEGPGTGRWGHARPRQLVVARAAAAA